MKIQAFLSVLIVLVCPATFVVAQQSDAEAGDVPVGGAVESIEFTTSVTPPLYAISKARMAQLLEAGSRNDKRLRGSPNATNGLPRLRRPGSKTGTTHVFFLTG